MPRFTIETSGIELIYFATPEDAVKVDAYRKALDAKYGPGEGFHLLHDAFRHATSDFTVKPKGKVLLEYLDGRFGHILPPSEAHLAAALEEAAAEGLVDVRELIAGATISTYEREPIY